MKDTWITVKEHLTPQDVEAVQTLADECRQAEAVALKLELEYKLGRATTQTLARSTALNEFFYFADARLVGYAGICRFGHGPLEVNGMVHPAYRRQGVFSQLWRLVRSEGERSGSLLLLSDRSSQAGAAFCQAVGAQYAHSEYEMVWQPAAGWMSAPAAVTLRPALNADAAEIARQNALFFGEEHSDSAGAETVTVWPEEEAQRGMYIYLAEHNGHIVGKVNVQKVDGVGGIYGLGVLPEWRGQGLGRAILQQAIGQLRTGEIKEIMLQVAVDNARALSLYTSCGFVTTSTMDYFRWEK